jgi:hypothetical protein
MDGFFPHSGCFSAILMLFNTNIGCEYVLKVLGKAKLPSGNRNAMVSGFAQRVYARRARHMALFQEAD